MKDRLTVKEAAILVGRHTRAVYRWISDSKLPAEIGDRGETLVASEDVLRVEAETRRGRPRIVR